MLIKLKENIVKKTLLFATLSTLMVTQAYASAGGYDIGKMATEANLVFQGSVVDVEYRGSQGKGKQGSIPHTFVTYEINDVLHGNANRKKFTLRFLGGKSKKGEVMMVSNTPKFDVGDKDIIFVDGNGISECPLIDCVNGRFRIINDLMYTEYGEPIKLDDKKELLTGKSQQLEEVDTFNIGDKTYKRLKNRDSQFEDDGSGSATNERQGLHLDAGTFIGEIRNKIAMAIPDDPQGTKKKAKHVDKNRAFSYAHSQAVSLPEPKVTSSGDQPMSEQERAEVAAMQKNNGNPVIK